MATKLIRSVEVVNEDIKKIFKKHKVKVFPGSEGFC